MKENKNKYDQLILVCLNDRPDRPCCKQKNSEELFKELKVRAAARSPRIRVTRTGCLGDCQEGAIVVLQPQNIWFEQVTVEDIDTILNHVSVEDFSKELDELLEL